METRAIEFRAWDIEKNKYHYPKLWDNSMPSNWGKHYILEQFTGLFDKNGNKIFEGDVVTCFDDELVVVFRHGAFYHKHKTKEAYGRLGETNYPFEENNIAKHYEIIGNIHNKEADND